MKRLRLLAVLCLVIAVSACAPAAPADPEAVGGTPAAARALVESWFTAARGGEPALGWSLIHPTARESVIGTEEHYAEVVAAADWSRFAYRITDVLVFDGQYQVEVAVPDGANGVPAFMTDWGIIGFADAGADGQDGVIFVRIPPAGDPAGILVG